VDRVSWRLVTTNAISKPAPNTVNICVPMIGFYAGNNFTGTDLLWWDHLVEHQHQTCGSVRSSLSAPARLATVGSEAAETMYLTHSGMRK
jgi:hypothetical protein